MELPPWYAGEGDDRAVTCFRREAQFQSFAPALRHLVIFPQGNHLVPHLQEKVEECEGRREDSIV